MIARQGAFEFRTWGGRRKGAGRPPNGERAGVAHEARPELKGRHPLLVTMKTVPEVGRLRTDRAYGAIRRAMAGAVGDWDDLPPFRICHASIQGNHIHLLVEADDKQALSRGMHAFTISCAKQLNTEIGNADGSGPRRGKAFVDRYHAVVLATPTQVRNALAYVFNNWRKHGEDRGSRARLDRFSSAAALPDWAPRRPAPFASAPLLPVWHPRTWLLAEGWRRAGPISPWQRPGARPVARLDSA